MKRNFDESPNLPSPKAIIYKSELDFISRCILDYPNIETGGELFGFWTQLGTPIVMYAVGPGPRARHNQTSFIQDPNYVDNIEVEICNRTGLQHIGQWHSHHQLSLAQPSGGDVASMQRGVGLPGFPRMLLCIGNCTNTYSTVNAFNFHENTPGRYSEAFWDIINIDSPFRNVIDGMFQNSLYMPRTNRASHGEMRIINKGTFPQEVRPQHWLTEKVENVELMKEFISMAGEIYRGSEPSAEIMESGEPLITMYNGLIKIMLPYGFPESAPIFIIKDGKECSMSDPINKRGLKNWNLLSGPLNMMFSKWLNHTMHCDQLLEAGETEKYVSLDEIPLETESDRALVQTIDFNDSMRSNDASADHINRFEREKSIISSHILPNWYRYTRLDNGYNELQSIIFPYNSQNRIMIRITRNPDFNLVKVEYGTLLPQATVDQIEYRPISELIPNADSFLMNHVTSHITEYDAYKMVSMLYHQWENAFRTGCDFKQICLHINMDKNILFQLLQQEESMIRQNYNNC